MLQRITSLQNERIKHFSRLYREKYRDKTNQYIVEGINLIEEALKNGAFYASTGPEIYELYLDEEDGEMKVTIRTSPAVGIYCSTATRRRYRKLMDENGNALLTEATFRIDPEDFCFRISVKDERGDHANTRMFFLDEIKA